MDRTEFAVVMGILAAGTGKGISGATMEVYFGLLGDLPLAVLQLAAQRALLESEYPVFPQVGTLRRLALEVQQHSRLPAIEAWAILSAALRRYGYNRPKDGLASLPAEVRRTAECLGWRELCDATETEIVRAQFCKAYDAQQKRADVTRLMPERIRREVEGIGQSVTETKGIGQRPVREDNENE